VRYRQLRLRPPPRPLDVGHDFNYRPSALKWWFLASLVVILAALTAVAEYSLHALPQYDNPALAELTNFTQKIFGRDDQTGGQAHPNGSLTSPVTTDIPTSPASTWGGGSATTSRPPSTTKTFKNLPPSSYMTSGRVTMSYYTKGGVTTFCFTCATPVWSTLPEGYLTTGHTTSTITPWPVVTTTAVTVVPHTTTLPPESTTVYTTGWDSAGNPTTQAIPTLLPGSTSVGSSTITIPPGMVWKTVTSTLSSTVNGTPTQVTTTVATLAPVETPQAEANGTITVVVGLTSDEYFAGAFLPTVIAVLLVQPLKLIDVNAKLFQPFHALTRRGGASAQASVFLRFYGWPGILTFPRAIRLGQPVVIVSELVVFLAAFLVPIAAESVAVHVQPGCTGGCYGDLGVAGVPLRVLEGLMITIAALLLLLLFLLSGSRWRTGVRQNPWSIAGMASLGLNEDVRTLLRAMPRGLARKVQDWEVAQVLEGKTYALKAFRARELSGVKGYGVVISGHSDPSATRRPAARKSQAEGEPGEKKIRGKQRIMSFALLTWWGRGALLFVLSSILIILIYYETTSGDTGFERFMDSQGFGVRFFFTALGVMLGFSMGTFFRCESSPAPSESQGTATDVTAFLVGVAVLSPFLLLSRQPLPASHSILLTPPTNPYTGLHAAFRQRHPYLGMLAISTLLGELFLPVTLAHVPFSLVETHQTQVVCAWMSVAILALMVVAVAASFLIRWPHMPVDPRTVAGALFYVCDSWMLDGLEGVSAMGKGERDGALRRMGLRYAFGEMTGIRGKERVGIDDLGKDGA